MRQVKRKETREKNQNEKQRHFEHTHATLPIHYKVILVREGGKKYGEELRAFLTSTSP